MAVVRRAQAVLSLALGLFVAVVNAHADEPLDHSKTRFPLSGRHQKVACESCHPAGAGTRIWKGVPLDCHGCHGDRSNHKGALGVQCQLCHDVSGWKSVRHPAAQHQLALVGKHSLRCASCHAAGAHLTAAATCAACHVQPHGGTSSPCKTCHVVDNWKTVAFKQHTYDPELLPGKHRTATCLGCHPAFHFKGTTQSLRCETCHRKDQPHEDLGACRRCHSPLAWNNITPVAPGEHQPAEKVAPDSRSTERSSSFRVTAKFNHGAHAQTVSARGLKPTCAPCHGGGGINFQNRPAMQVCEGCHDGKKAFDALGTQCYRCHATPPGALLAALPPAPKTFQHGAHAKRDVKIDDCTSCHGVGLALTQVQAGSDQHRPCQGCHAAEFRKEGQTICLACHLRNDPFRPNPLRLPTTVNTEWRSPDASDLPHAPHLAAGVACEACHPTQSGVATSSPALGHEVCGKCHLAERLPKEKEIKGVTPVPLDRCSACHVLLSVPRGGARRPWTTRELFRHDKNHLVQACGSCHVPNGTSAMISPTMQGCATCHDGKKAFNTIGHECARCHGVEQRVN